MPSIGSIRVDFLADVTKFVSGMNQASTGLSRFLHDVHKGIGGAERATQKFGAGMTVKVTAPIAGMALAAVRAADVNGEAMKRMQDDAKRMQQAFAPIGREIIRAYDSARPTIKALSDTVRSAAESFEKMPQPTKDLIIKAVAITAAVGPASLALSSMLKVVGAGILPLTKIAGGMAALTNGATTLSAAMSAGTTAKWFSDLAKGNGVLATTVVLMKAAAVSATALVGIEIGRWLYDQFPLVQRFGATIVGIFGVYKAAIWDTAKRTIEGIKLLFSELMFQIPDKIARVISTIGNSLKRVRLFPDDEAEKNWKKQISGFTNIADGWLANNPDRTKGFLGGMYDIQSRLKGDMALPFKTWWQTQKDITAAGAGKWLTSAEDPISFMLGDFKRLKAALQDVFALGPASADASNTAWKQWADTTKAVSGHLQDLTSFAQQMNSKYTPEIVKLQQELDKLDMLRVEGLVGGNGPLSMENWKRAVTDIRKQMKEVENAVAPLVWDDKGVWEAFSKSYREAIDGLKSEYLQAYPAVAFDQDIARLRKLATEFAARGDTVTADMANAVIDAKFSERTRKVAEESLRVWQKQQADIEKLRKDMDEKWNETFGGKLAKGIGGFASTFSAQVDEMRRSGSLAFDDLADSFGSMILRMSIEAASSPWFEALGSWAARLVGNPRPGSGISPTPIITPLPNPGGLAFASGGITSRPFFTAVAGEREREVIAPLSQLPGLLRQAGLGGASVQIIDQRTGGAPVQVRESRGPDGRRLITAIIKDAMAGGEMDGIMSQRFNTRANPR